jgi:hypothetical protein
LDRGRAGEDGGVKKKKKKKKKETRERERERERNESSYPDTTIL